MTIVYKAFASECGCVAPQYMCRHYSASVYLSGIPRLAFYGGGSGCTYTLSLSFISSKDSICCGIQGILERARPPSADRFRTHRNRYQPSESMREHTSTPAFCLSTHVCIVCSFLKPPPSRAIIAVMKHEPLALLAERPA